jgi:hypothetical protein
MAGLPREFHFLTFVALYQHRTHAGACFSHSGCRRWLKRDGVLNWGGGQGRGKEMGAGERIGKFLFSANNETCAHMTTIPAPPDFNARIEFKVNLADGGPKKKRRLRISHGLGGLAKSEMSLGSELWGRRQSHAMRTRARAHAVLRERSDESSNGSPSRERKSYVFFSIAILSIFRSASPFFLRSSILVRATCSPVAFSSPSAT